MFTRIAGDAVVRATGRGERVPARGRILVHVEVDALDQGVPPGQPVRVEHRVGQLHQIGGRLGTVVATSGRQPLEPHVFHQPPVARRIAYAAQRARHGRPRERRLMRLVAGGYSRVEQ